MPDTILVLDIGSGTQDVLLYDPSLEIENCPKFVLPAPARGVAARIAALTAAGRGVYLHGRNMGGGFGGAVRRHVGAGLPVAAHPEAAFALTDDPSRIGGLGVVLAETCPEGFAPVHQADFDPGFWRAFLGAAGLELPSAVMAAAQDHGLHPGASSRVGRFELWERFLRQTDGRPEELVYARVPEKLTRLRALQEAIGGGLVADTAAAAVLGALSVPEVLARSRETGLCLVNMGNSHTLGALVFDGRIHGIYEQHAGLIDADRVWSDLARFRRGALSNAEVFEAGGHGCLTLDLPSGAGGFAPTLVLGPKRGQLSGFEVEYPCPGGDMMLAGCFGLLWGRRRG